MHLSRTRSRPSRRVSLDRPVARRRAPGAQRVRRRRLGALLSLALALAALVLVLGDGGKGTPAKRVRSRPPATASPVTTRMRVALVQTGTLPAAVQDAAAVVVAPATFLLLGGIDSAEASLAAIVRADGVHASTIGALPNALHDASASFVDGAAYLFGGGVVSSFPQITRVQANGSSSPAGQLPTSASDVASATIGETVYVVGGYTGQAPLRTILAWRPGEAPRVAAMLPEPLRYAAVAAVGGQLMIAGGTRGETASRDIYRFDPSTGRLRNVGTLPHPLTHAAAVALDGNMLVFGGRGSSPDSQTRGILAISPDGGLEAVGVLPVALSDLAAVPLSGHVVLAGGRDPSGTVHDELLTATVTVSSVAGR